MKEVDLQRHHLLNPSLFDNAKMLSPCLLLWVIVSIASDVEEAEHYYFF